MRKIGSVFLKRTEILVVNSSPELVKHAAEKLVKKLTPKIGIVSDPLMPITPGSVWNNGFELVFRRSYPQHFAPYIKASFSACSSGTMIMLHYRLQPQTNFFLIVSLVIGLITSFTFIFIAGQVHIGLLIWIVLSLIYVFVSHQFRQLSQEASNITAEHFHDLSDLKT